MKVIIKIKNKKKYQYGIIHRTIFSTVKRIMKHIKPVHGQNSTIKPVELKPGVQVEIFGGRNQMQSENKFFKSDRIFISINPAENLGVKVEKRLTYSNRLDDVEAKILPVGNFNSKSLVDAEEAQDLSMTYAVNPAIPDKQIRAREVKDELMSFGVKPEPQEESTVNDVIGNQEVSNLSNFSNNINSDAKIEELSRKLREMQQAQQELQDLTLKQEALLEKMSLKQDQLLAKISSVSEAQLVAKQKLSSNSMDSKEEAQAQGMSLWLLRRLGGLLLLGLGYEIHEIWGARVKATEEYKEFSDIITKTGERSIRLARTGLEETTEHTVESMSPFDNLPQTKETGDNEIERIEYRK